MLGGIVGFCVGTLFLIGAGTAIRDGEPMGMILLFGVPAIMMFSGGGFCMRKGRKVSEQIRQKRPSPKP